jgi:hypothetical protein
MPDHTARKVAAVKRNLGPPSYPIPNDGPLVCSPERAAENPLMSTDRRWSLAGRLRVKAEIIGRRTGLEYKNGSRSWTCSTPSARGRRRHTSIWASRAASPRSTSVKPPALASFVPGADDWYDGVNRLSLLSPKGIDNRNDRRPNAELRLRRGRA